MKTKHRIWIAGGCAVLVTAVSWLAIQHTDSDATINTKTKPNQVVYKQEAKPTIASTVKPLVTYAKTSNHSKAPYRKPFVAPGKKVTEEKRDIKLFSTDYLPMQHFTISNLRDTQLIAAGGMKVSIPSHAFVYTDGRQAEGAITIEMKEAFTPESIVMANLVTMKGNELLESGGMYYINAKAADANLQIAGGKELTVEVPSLSKKEGMELYEGRQSKAGLDWANPVALNKEEQKLKEAWAEAVEFLDIRPQKNKVFARAKRSDMDDEPIIRDSLGWMQKEQVPENWIEALSSRPPQPGTNTFSQDTKMNYLMNTNRLGWANIDRLYSDPRSRRITFVTDVEHKAEFESVYITMLFKSQKVYIPGYQKQDGTYSFTHGDYEDPVLPVGEEAVIMVSAYKKGRQYFALKNVTISNKMKVMLSPALMEAGEIEQQVNNSL